MTFGRYVETPPGDWARLRRALEQGDVTSSVRELLGLALHEEDGQRVQAECLRLLDHEWADLRWNAATGLGHLARLHGTLDDRAVAELLWRVDDPEIGGAVSDALDDYRWYVERELPMREAFRPRFFLELLRSVARLALPVAEQIAYLEGIGTAPLADELALEFDEGLRLVPQFRELGWLAADEVDLLESIDAALEAVSDDLWDVDALGAPEWEVVRGRAQAFLNRQGHRQRTVS